MTVRKAASNLAYYYELKAQIATKPGLPERYRDLVSYWRRRAEQAEEA
jgi:hypothetical protein